MSVPGETGESVPPFEVDVLTTAEPQDVEDFVRLRPYLSETLKTPEAIGTYLQECLASPNTRVFIIRDDDGRIQATSTAIVYATPYARKGIVDEVVRDGKAAYGKGYGDKLQTAVDNWLIEERGVDRVQLTSNHTRIRAGELYENHGYVQHGTRVFRKVGRVATNSKE